RRTPGRKRCRSPGRQNDVDVESHKLCSKAWKLVETPVRGPAFDADVPAVDVSPRRKPCWNASTNALGGCPALRKPIRYTFSACCAPTASSTRTPTAITTASPITRIGHLLGMAGGSLADLNYATEAATERSASYRAGTTIP